MARLHPASFHQNYFDEINTEEKAYWLGFFTADGCVTDRGQVSLGLTAGDFEHVTRFRDALGLTGHISYATNCIGPTKYRSCRFQVGSRRLSSSLALHNIRPRKTGSTVPAVIDADLKRHYWRGVVDGDGCITYSTEKRSASQRLAWELKLVGDYPIVLAFSDFCADVIVSGAKIKQVQPRLWEIRYGGKFGFAIADTLYKNSTVFLPRKYKKYTTWLSQPMEVRQPYRHTEECKTHLSNVMRLRGNMRAGIPSKLKGRKYESVLVDGIMRRRLMPLVE